MSDQLVNEVIDTYKQWMIGATKSRAPVRPKSNFGVHPGRSYNLKNKKAIKYLQHEKQTFGINLGWTDDASNATGDKVARWFFARNAANDDPVRFGELIALGNGGSPSFLKYEERRTGINLAWSETPVFEWKLLGGKPGEPVQTQTWIAILNTRSEGGECLIHFDRTVGGDIGWPSSKTWSEQFVSKVGDAAWQRAKEAAMKAITSGAG